MSKKMDRKLVASKQPWEPQEVARKFKIPVAIVRVVMLDISNTDKPCRSRKKIEKEIKRKIAAGEIKVKVK